ncbi:ABC transporter ATP-binding protein [Burkholderia sp. BCC0419]|uniref:ABC transporter ATP-binding protein n=1 Tax=Burkholderia sp. BCC0419 TaxID=486878 RepID=UPI00158DBCB2|nr:ABC transporter ATP-binding protein [Burkholderia sp. BCC0419]
MSATFPTDAPVRVSFRNVSMEFCTPQGRIRVLDDVSLNIRQGEFISIVGPSGCGKTTLMNLLGGFAQPTSGQVLLDGRPVAGPGPDRGVIFQEYGVFPWLTVRQNIAFGLKLSGSKIPRAGHHEIVQRYMALMGLKDFADHFPKQLSGGMRQRLAIARAYAVQPQFLLMDEPFGALDDQTRSAMQNLLLEVLQTEGKTVLLITHSVDEAIYLSSRIIVVTARPARVRAVIDVPFGYPRTESVYEDRRFGELRAHIRALVMEEYAVQTQQTGQSMD